MRKSYINFSNIGCSIFELISKYSEILFKGLPERINFVCDAHSTLVVSRFLCYVTSRLMLISKLAHDENNTS